MNATRFGCPACGARAGEFCRVLGRDMSTVHTDRVQLVDRWIGSFQGEPWNIETFFAGADVMGLPACDMDRWSEIANPRIVAGDMLRAVCAGEFD